MRIASAALVAALVALARPVAADSGVPVAVGTELRPLSSFTVSDAELLRGTARAGRRVTLAGELAIPLESSGKVPAVILLHGSAGVLPYVTEWRDEFARMGVATLIVDSFSGRGIAGTIPDQDRLGRLNAVLDAYQALALLRAHARIDPERIVLMGFSRGGDAALYAALDRFRKAYGAGGAFAAHVAFYPNCGTRYREDTAVAKDRPILILHGTADDYAPIAACRAYAARLRAAGASVELDAFEGAHHVFMWRELEQVTALETGQTTRACDLVEREDGVVINAATGQPFTHKDPCVQVGPHVGYDARAAEQARGAVKRLVADVIRK